MIILLAPIIWPIILVAPITLLIMITDPVSGCNMCISSLEYLSKITGLSYELINVLLFVILGPLTTVLFGISTVLALYNKKKLAIIIGSVSTIIAFVVITTCAFALLTNPGDIHFVGFTDVVYLD